MLERIERWWRTQRDIQALEGLDDRMLDDIGLGREEIRRRVRGEDGAGWAPRGRARPEACAP